MPTLAGTSVVVFGATGGLGSQIARIACDRGARVALVARDAARLGALGLPGRQIPADLRLPDAAATVLDTVLAEHGSVDVVVNATGVVAFGPVDELTVDVLEELFLTNVFVPVFIAKAALERLAPGGMVVNISGVIAEQNLPGMAAYGASKAALRSFDEALGREARRRKLRVLDARPGHTETGLASRAIAGVAPAFAHGLDPVHVATVIVDGIEADVNDLPSTAF
jgi:cyclic-di-GMP-binding biofilm dispersal mediator protein